LYCGHGSDAAGAGLDGRRGVRDRRPGAESTGGGNREDECLLPKAVGLDVVESRLQLVAVEGEQDVVAAGAPRELLDFVADLFDADRAPPSPDGRCRGRARAGYRDPAVLPRSHRERRPR
jgi:hypothetical protein